MRKISVNIWVNEDPKLAGCERYVYLNTENPCHKWGTSMIGWIITPQGQCLRLVKSNTGGWPTMDGNNSVSPKTVRIHEGLKRVQFFYYEKNHHQS